MNTIIYNQIDPKLKNMLLSFVREGIDNLSEDKICKLLQVFEYGFPQKLQKTLTYAWKKAKHKITASGEDGYVLTKSGIDSETGNTLCNIYIHQLSEYEAKLVVLDKIKTIVGNKY